MSINPAFWRRFILIMLLGAAGFFIYQPHHAALSQNGSSLRLIEAEDPTLEKTGTWTVAASPHASGGNYIYSSGSAGDVITLEFSGTTVEIVYLYHPNFGSMAIEIDNSVVRTVVVRGDTDFGARQKIDYLSAGAHTLRIYPAFGVIAVDAIYAGSAAETPGDDPTTPASGTSYFGMDNPAAVYCRQMGYDYHTETAADGSQNGYCTFPDGEVCEQWSFLNGTCGQEHSYCAQQGYAIRTRPSGGEFSPAHAVCVLPTRLDAGIQSNTEVPVTELFSLSARARGCPDGNCINTNTAPVIFSAPVEQQAPLTASVMAAPASFDWRNYSGADWVTPVRNQASCGSCWAFATVAATEAMYNIRSGSPALDYDLSEQSQVSCSGAGSCNGGYVDGSFNYIKNSGVPDEACMPYTATNNSCGNRCADWSSRARKISGWEWLASDRATIQQKISTQGPVVILMGIGSQWQGYFDSNNVYRCTNDGGVDHAVLAVGYDNAGGYWIIKNSWGTYWGSSGYFKLGYGECSAERYPFAANVATAISAPTLSAPASATRTNVTAQNFSWSAVSGALQYQIQIDNNADFSSPIATYNTTLTSYSRTLSNGTYYWRTRAQVATTWSAWNAAWTLIIDTVPPTAPSLSSPANAATTSTLTFKWAATGGATLYQFQFDEDALFGSPNFDTTTAATSVTIGSQTSAKYYWRVRAKDAAGNWGAWATRYYNLAPVAPILNTPSTTAFTIDTTPYFDWGTVSDAALYHLQVSPASDFSSLTLNLQMPTDYFNTLTALTYRRYYWRVRVQSTAGFWSVWSPAFNFTLTAALPPTLSAPAHTGQTTSQFPLFSWNTAAGAVTYQLQVSPSSSFSSLTINALDLGTSYTHTKALGYANYFWRVRGKNAAGVWGSWSVTNQVRVTAAQPPNLTAPSTNLITTNRQPFFGWNSAEGASTYQIQVSPSTSFSSLTVNVTALSGTSYLPTTPLGYTTYYWRVRGRNSAGVYGSWSASWKLTVTAMMPPNLIEPANVSTTIYTMTWFGWDGMSGATAYQIQISPYSNFSSLSQNVVLTSTYFYPGTPLGYRQYFWRVRAKNSAGVWGLWSATWSFTIVR